MGQTRCAFTLSHSCSFGGPIKWVSDSVESLSCLELFTNKGFRTGVYVSDFSWLVILVFGCCALHPKVGKELCVIWYYLKISGILILLLPPRGGGRGKFYPASTAPPHLFPSSPTAHGRILAKTHKHWQRGMPPHTHAQRIDSGHILWAGVWCIRARWRGGSSSSLEKPWRGASARCCAFWMGGGFSPHR
jgi:hypothetical protein